jgi:transmembrane 9 superfamily protein 2/4
MCLRCHVYDARILDNLPVAMVKMRKDDRQPNSLVKTYERGFPIGFRASLEVCCGSASVHHPWEEQQVAEQWGLLSVHAMGGSAQEAITHLSHPSFSQQGQTEVKFFLHNHLRFSILYHKDVETDLARIVGFEVEPFSVKHTYEGAWDKSSPVLDTCNPGRMTYVTHNLPPQPVAEGNEVIFSYDVRFVVGIRAWLIRQRAGFSSSS